MKRQSSELFCSGNRKESSSKVSAFTIVELLVVIVVIGILAAVTIISYSGINNKAIAALLKSDLDNNSKLLKMYNVEYGYYPDSLGTDNCPNAPTPSAVYCLKASKGATLSYSGSGQNFVLTSTHTSSGKSYQVTETGISYAVTGGGEISTFARSWNSTAGNEDKGFAIKNTSDGGFVVAGNVYSDETSNYDGFVAKYTSNGLISWAKKYVEVGYDQINSIIQASDGGYAIAGFADVNGDERGDAILSRLDSNGAVVWSRSWGRDGDDYAKSVIQTSSGDFIIAGHCTSMNSEDSAAFIAKYDSSGNPIWSKSWGSSGIVNSVIATDDGNYILIGSVYYAGTQDELVTKFSSDGSMIWSKLYNYNISDNNASGYGIFQTSDRGYFMIGNIGNNRFLITAKISDNGAVAWSRQYDEATNSDYGLGTAQAMDGSYLITTGNEVVIRLTSDGAFSWGNYLAVDNYSYMQIANSITQLTDGGIVAAGFIGDVGNQRDIYTAKYKTNGAINNCASPNECGRFDIIASNNQINIINDPEAFVTPSYLVTGSLTLTEVSLSPTVTTIVAP